MRTAQELFKVIIEAGHYKPEHEDQERCPEKYPAMCLSAHSACLAGTITEGERLRVFTAAQRYINHLLDQLGEYFGPSYLGPVLGEVGLPSTPEDRKHLYLNWDARKEFKK